MRGRFEDEFTGGSALIVIGAFFLIVASFSVTATRGLIEPEIALGFGVLVAFGELVRINLPGDRTAAPIGMAAALGYALVEEFAGVGQTSYGVAQVVSVVAVGIVVGTIPHVAVGQAPRLDALARRVLVAGFAAALFRPLLTGGQLDGFSGWQLPAFMLVIVALSGIADALLAALSRATRERVPVVAAARDELRALVGIGSAIGATGVLIALASEVMGFWALPVFALPLLVAQFSFRRYASIRATYLQTIRALSRVTEVGGYTETGHARRVAQLSMAVGRELGMSEADLVDLEYAALMHDIGQLSLTDPIPGGATVMVSPEERRRIADLGAEVIRQTGVLDRVALIVERQAEPHRRPGRPLDAGIPLASRIIKVVNAYDDLVGGSLDGERRLAALERLRMGVTEEYDPRVVATLTGVVERTTLLPL